MTTPTDATIQQKATTDWSWLQHHLVSFALMAVLIIGSVYGIFSIIARHDHENALEKTAFAQTLQQQNTVFQAQTQTQINTLVQQNAALQQQVGALATAITTRDAQLRTVQATVPQMSPDQLSLEWQKDLKNAGNIKPITGGYLVDQAAAVASVQAIEAVPVLQLDVADLQKKADNLSVQYVNEVAIYEDEKKARASDNAANTATITAKNAEIKDIKAQNRKRNMIIGVVCFIGGLVAHAAGI